MTSATRVTYLNSAIFVRYSLVCVVTNCDSTRRSVTQLYTVSMALLYVEHTRLGCMPLVTYAHNTLVLALVYLCEVSVCMRSVCHPIQLSFKVVHCSFRISKDIQLWPLG
jgi:hypothetical protein